MNPTSEDVHPLDPDPSFYPKTVIRSTATVKPRCARCSKVLAWFVTEPWKIRCPRCGLDNGAEPAGQRG